VVFEFFSLVGIQEFIWKIYRLPAFAFLQVSLSVICIFVSEGKFFRYATNNRERKQI